MKPEIIKQAIKELYASWETELSDNDDYIDRDYRDRAFMRWILGLDD